MDEFIKGLITQAPNLAIAVVVLYWQKKTIDMLLANQTALIDRLLAYADDDRMEARLRELIPED